MTSELKTLVRHEGEVPRERSTCGWRDRLISRENSGVVAWVHAVDIESAREHYHKRATELYYVLEGEGVVVLDGTEHAVRKGSLVHIPPGVVHGAKGRMRVLVTGIPDIADDDLFYPGEACLQRCRSSCSRRTICRSRPAILVCSFSMAWNARFNFDIQRRIAARSLAS